ncbi:pre-mRNA-splicing factor CWC22-like protein, partial [Trifolium medium]|nr:pre-mRNA-splicing factor CWC22-like protein [Trifolium medium]
DGDNEKERDRRGDDDRRGNGERRQRVEKNRDNEREEIRKKEEGRGGAIPAIPASGINGDASTLGKSGGVYIPPFKLARMMREV